jgi:putative hydrolase of the HAD superfamily
MERGEIDEATFHRRLEAEAKALGGAVDARLLLSRISGTLHPEMVALVRRLRDRYRVACLTNNMRIGLGPAMSSTPERAAEIAEVIKLFEHVVESCRIGARKPEARFFEIACATVGVKPDECVYLDDLGINLKPARALGMQTIKVVSPTQAIADLAAILGHA